MMERVEMMAVERMMKPMVANTARRKPLSGMELT